MKDNLVNFAMKLKMLRQKRKLTLEKLAEIADLTPNHIAKLEAAKSNPSFDSISNLANALEVEIKDLFDFEEIKNKNHIKEKLENFINKASEEELMLLYRIYQSINN